MLSYENSDSFLIEEVDHIYHVVGVKLEHFVFILLTFIAPVAFNFHLLYVLALIGLEVMVARHLTKRELLGKPLQYDKRFLEKIQGVKGLGKLVKFKVSLGKGSYRGDIPS